MAKPWCGLLSFQHKEIQNWSLVSLPRRCWISQVEWRLCAVVHLQSPQNLQVTYRWLKQRSLEVKKPSLQKQWDVLWLKLLFREQILLWILLFLWYFQCVLFSAHKQLIYINKLLKFPFSCKGHTKSIESSDLALPWHLQARLGIQSNHSRLF